MNVEEALKTSGRNNLQQPGVVRWRAARKLFIFRVQQLCLVMDYIVSVHLHVSSHVWIHMKNLVLFLGVTGDMQTLAGSGEIQGKGAIYPTDFPAARPGASQGPVLPCPNLSCSLVLCPVPVQVPVLWHCRNAGDQQLPKKHQPSYHVHLST